jgi:hypothetical protein
MNNFISPFTIKINIINIFYDQKGLFKIGVQVMSSATYCIDQTIDTKIPRAVTIYRWRYHNEIESRTVSSLRCSAA